MKTKMLPAIMTGMLWILTSATLNAQKCKDIPLTITFHQTAIPSNWDGTADTTAVPVPSAFVGDGNDVYVDSSGVGATIKFCSGTHDAVLNLLVSKRRLTARLPAPIPDSGANLYTPPADSYTRNGLLNIRNIICFGCVSPGQPFVTHVLVGLDTLMNTENYSFRFLPSANPTSLPVAGTVQSDDAAAAAMSNTPNATSWAVVLPQPYNCGQGVYPSWIVRGTLPNSSSQPSFMQVATLFDKDRNLNAGQFSMPFDIRVQANQCFNPGY